MLISKSLKDINANDNEAFNTAYNSQTKINPVPASVKDKHDIPCKVCPTCHIIKTPRVHHCSICDCCISVHDHHCTWIGTCIGQRNHLWFCVFLLSCILLCVLAIVQNVFLLTNSDTDLISAYTEKNAFLVPCIVTLVFGVIFFVLLSLLARFHFLLIKNNKTASESLKGKFD